MIWKETYNKESTDGKTHHIRCELWLDFEQTRWNKNIESPVLILDWHDKKTITSWPVCKLPNITQVRLFCKDGKGCDCNVWVSGLQRRFYVNINYFQRMPTFGFWSGIKGGSDNPVIVTPVKVSYDEFTLEYCKAKAIEIFKENLNKVIIQLP